VAERAPGSNRGRPAIDWEDAFTYYASLPASERSYRAVADHFGVSVRTVERHGREDGWKQRLGAIEAAAAAGNDARLAETRAKRRADLLRLIDASLTTYARQLSAGTTRVAPNHLTQFHRLLQELEHEEAAATAELRDQAVADPAHEEDVQARKLEIVRALDEAGVFDRLRRHAHGTAADTAREET
jgi:hypothetical protein